MSKRRIVVTASSAESRLAAAGRWLTDALVSNDEAFLLAPSRGAADDFLRRTCPADGGLFGVHRSTARQLAAELATRPMARAGLAPVSGLGTEALAARAISICTAGRQLSYFEPVADAPGLAGALATTLSELRANRVSGTDLAATGAPGQDLEHLRGHYEQALERWSLADEATLLELALQEVESRQHVLLGLPLLILDPTLSSLAEKRFLAAIVSRAPVAFATLVGGDATGQAALEEIFGTTVVDLDTGEEQDPRRLPAKLERLRRHVFTATSADPSNQSEEGHSGESTTAEESDDTDESFTLLSAAGEGRECIEIARRIHELAKGGLGFDGMAILLRDPTAYLPLVEEALRRAGVPAYFTHGTIRPHPAGRALLSLLDCASEGLSASRFAEYLSLAQVPLLDDAGEPPAVEVPWVAPEGDQLVFKTLLEPATAATLKAEPSAAPPVERPAVAAPVVASPVVDAPAPPESPVAGAPVIAGSLRAPRGWERLLVDARVIGGLDRWRARLTGLQHEMGLRLRDSAGEEPVRDKHLRTQLEDLRHLERFALPVIEILAGLPEIALWGEWLDTLEKLASRVLRQPERVLTVLAELRPMDRVGPVTLDEVRRALGQRLAAVRLEPPARRYGRVFVATIDEARGRTFEAVFLPGLAEGTFPRRATEDPLLLDTYRRELEAPLATQTERVAGERLLLRVAAGAASSRLIVSYPNLDVLQGRTRVPSFYALDLLRAAEGRLPDLHQLENRAAGGSQSLLGWPAPRHAEAAIDDAEYDLSVLEPLLRRGAPTVRGQGHFLLAANERLTRTLRSRWRRWRPSFSAADGVVDPDPATLTGLAHYRLDHRAYSPTSLQRFAACPYRFLLYSIHGLKPREEAVRLEQLDPLTRGSLFHEIQFELFQELEQRDLLSFEDSEEHAITTLLAEIVECVAERYHDNLAPAIERVWRSGIEELHTDLRGWVRSRILADEPWRPTHFELAFGFDRGTAPLDMRLSGNPLPEANVLDGKRLRGAIDLVEEDPDRNSLRVTDHKTGKSPGFRRLAVGGGKTLQPVLYGLAAEQLLGKPVESGRLYFCSRRGGYESLEVNLDEDARQAAGYVLGEIDHAISQGFMPAAPDQGECKWCDYRIVCGPHVETRLRRKHPQRLIRLTGVRKTP